MTAAVCYGEREPKLSIVSRENKPFELIGFKNDDFDNGDNVESNEDDNTDKEENSRNKFYLYYVDHHYEKLVSNADETKQKTKKMPRDI